MEYFNTSLVNQVINRNEVRIYSVFPVSSEKTQNVQDVFYRYIRNQSMELLYSSVFLFFDNQKNGIHRKTVIRNKTGKQQSMSLTTMPAFNTFDENRYFSIFSKELVSVIAMDSSANVRAGRTFQNRKINRADNRRISSLKMGIDIDM